MVSTLDLGGALYSSKSPRLDTDSMLVLTCSTNTVSPNIRSTARAQYLLGPVLEVVVLYARLHLIHRTVQQHAQHGAVQFDAHQNHEDERHARVVQLHTGRVYE